MSSFTINVVTTFHKKGFDEYGNRMLETFAQHWPKSVKMTVYAEDCADLVTRYENFTVLDLHQQCPELVNFKNIYKNDTRANGQCPDIPEKTMFKWDAVRFSNKVYAVCDAINNTKSDYVIWLDADTVTHSDVTYDFLQEVLPNHHQAVSYLNRADYPECGFVGYNINHPIMKQFAHDWQHLYASGNFLNLQESHDSFTFQHMIENVFDAPRKHLGDSTKKGHIFINSRLGDVMDHLKGPRKKHKHSFAKDLWSAKPQQWWKNNV